VRPPCRPAARRRRPPAAAAAPHAAALHRPRSSHGAVGRRADGSYFYTHGGFAGHILPGSLFIALGAWWLAATAHHFVRAAAARRAFAPRAWYPLFFGPARLRAFPLEPALLLALPLVGIAAELWLGHESWRTLVAPDGKFVVDNINDWQHSTMYLSFAVSGAVSLLGSVAPLPRGTEAGFLGLAFLCEGLLLVFHLKGPDVERLLHLVLVLIVFATSAAAFAEAGGGARRVSAVGAAARPALTLLQGVWWIQSAYAMYTADPRYDPDYMGAAMMLPAVLVVHALWVAVAALTALLVSQAAHARLLGAPVPFEPTQGEGEGGGGGYALADAAPEDGAPRRGDSLELAAYAMPK
jgi:hypothetical protein